jgi:acyl-CoA reductase-like NAD-dependent aldehyde dehydrogenase
MVITYNATTGEITEREMTAEEVTQREIDKAYAAAEAQAEAQAATARQALLDKLGITADEAKLLLG